MKCPTTKLGNGTVNFEFNVQTWNLRHKRSVCYTKALESHQKVIALNLSNANLQAMNLGGLNFEYARFDNAFLDMTSFNGAKLSHAQFNEASMQSTHFNEAELTAAKFNAQEDELFVLDSVQFNSANLTKTEFNDAFLENVEFTEAILIKTQFSGTSLSGAKFGRARLHGGTIELLDINASYATATSFRALEITTFASRSELQDFLQYSFGDASVTLPENVMRPVSWPDQVLNDDTFATEWTLFKKDRNAYIPPQLRDER